MPQHVVGDAQDALELRQGTLAGGELHDHVVTVRPVINLVCQLPAAPVVDFPGSPVRSMIVRKRAIVFSTCSSSSSGIIMSMTS